MPAARPLPVRSAGTEAGGAPGPAGRGWRRGRRGAGPGLVRGVKDRERVEEPPPPPEPELEDGEVEAAAAGCRLRVGLHGGASSGFLGCRRRCESQELVESTSEPPPEQLEDRGLQVLSRKGRWGPLFSGCVPCRPPRPSRALVARCTP